MKQISIREQDEFIKLGQALKKADLVSSGVEAKIVIQDGQVTVNGETELQRGKKLHDGDVFSYDGETVKVVKLTGEGPVKRRIMDMGITKNVEIFVRKVAPLGDPIEVNVRNYELSIRKADAEMIIVE